MDLLSRYTPTHPQSHNHLLYFRHREVAPGQYEFAPLFGTVTTQIDQNLVVMQVRHFQHTTEDL